MAMNPQNVLSQLRMMSDQQLQQYAAMHKNDPFIFPLAFQESQTRKQIRAEAQTAQAAPQEKVVDQDLAAMTPQQEMPQQQMPQAQAQPLPEDVGIGQLPADNLKGMAGGGIVAFEDGGEVKHFYQGDQVKSRKNQFAAENRDLAEQVGKRLGVDPNIFIAHWGLETGWGKSPVGKYNYGNIKDITGKGPRAYDKAEKSYDAYKSYDSPQAFADDYASLILRNYPKALNTGSDVNAFWEGMRRGKTGSYGTDPDYASKLQKTYAGLGSAAITPSTPTTAPMSTLAKTISGFIPSAFAATGPDTKPAATQAAPSASEPRSQWGAVGDLGRHLVGAGETALQYGTGLLAIPTAGGAAVLEQLPNVFSGKGMDKKEMEKSFLDKAGQVTYAPRTEAGKEQSAGLASILTNDLKLPPYLAHTGSLPAQRRTSNAANLAEIAAERTRTSELPRLAGPTTDTTMVQGRGAPPVKDGNLVRKQMQDIEAAAAWREAAARAEKTPDINTTPEVLARNAATERAQTVSRIGGSNVAPAAGTIAGSGSDTGSASPPTNLNYETGFEDYVKQMPKEDKTEIKDLGKEAAKDAGVKTKGWTGDDFIAMGLGILSGNSPYTLQNVGEGGLRGLAMRQARLKEESDTAYKEALAEHHLAAAKTAGIPQIAQVMQLLKDPKNVALYKQMKELEREPMTKESLWKQFMTQNALLLKPEEVPAAFRKYVQSYENEFGPLGGVPQGVVVTPRAS